MAISGDQCKEPAVERMVWRIPTPDPNHAPSYAKREPSLFAGVRDWSTWSRRRRGVGRRGLRRGVGG